MDKSWWFDDAPNSRKIGRFRVEFFAHVASGQLAESATLHPKTVEDLVDFWNSSFWDSLSPEITLKNELYILQCAPPMRLKT